MRPLAALHGGISDVITFPGNLRNTLSDQEATPPSTGKPSWSGLERQLHIMGRQEKIARSVVRAITSSNGLDHRPRNPLAWILACFSLFFSLYQLALRKICPADFANLRRNHWDLSDDEYVGSFQQPGDDANQEQALKAIGDMGFSGSVSGYTSSR